MMVLNKASGITIMPFNVVNLFAVLWTGAVAVPKYLYILKYKCCNSNKEPMALSQWWNRQLDVFC